MSLYPELHRLLARGPDALPEELLIDCGAIERWVAEVQPGADPWPAFVEAAHRSHRTLLFLVAPTAKAHAVVDAAHLRDLEVRLSGLLGGAARGSLEPASSIAASQSTLGGHGLVTAGITERPYELWVLASGVDAVLDVATGRVWRRDDAEKALGPLESLPLRSTLVADNDGKALVAGVGPYEENIRADAPDLDPLALAGMLSQQRIPKPIRDAIIAKMPMLKAEALVRCGDGRTDLGARAWCFPASQVAPSGVPSTYYVVAEVDGMEIRFVAIISPSSPSQTVRATGHEKCVELLRQAALDRANPRWFAPRALDLLAAMVEAELPLPASAIDPAVCAYALDPIATPRLENLLPDLLVLSRELRRWMGDARRKAQPPSPRELSWLLPFLPLLDLTLQQALAQNGLLSLVEADIGPTLPVLASVEREGMLIGAPPTERAALRQRHVAAAQAIAATARAFLGQDAVSASHRQIVERLRRMVGSLTGDYQVPGLTHEEEFERYVALGSPEANDIKRVRADLSPSTTRWFQRLESGESRLRGISVPQRTGRWTFREDPLHSLPKASSSAWMIRQHLVAPPGMLLMSADWNAFEPRLLASLTCDATLLRAASTEDFHAAVATMLSLTRGEAKSAVLAITNGQSRLRFQRAMAGVKADQAGKVYDALEKLTPGVARERSRIGRELRRNDGVVQIPGGWKLRVGSSRRAKALNAKVQGLGATILRWVLRELHEPLRGMGARVVFHHHDEVVVACPDSEGLTGIVSAVLRLTMNWRVSHTSGLLPSPINLPVRIKTGKTWADLL